MVVRREQEWRGNSVRREQLTPNFLRDFLGRKASLRQHRWHQGSSKRGGQTFHNFVSVLRFTFVIYYLVIY